MKKLIFSTGLVVILAAARAIGVEPSDTTRQPDRVSVELGGVGTAIGSAATNYNPAPGVSGSIGTYRCRISEGEWLSVPSHILSKLSAALKADGWTSQSPMTCVPVDAVTPLPLVVIASKGDRMLEVLITIFPSTTGTTGIAYWLRYGPNNSAVPTP